MLLGLIVKRLRHNVFIITCEGSIPSEANQCGIFHAYYETWTPTKFSYY